MSELVLLKALRWADIDCQFCAHANEYEQDCEHADCDCETCVCKECPCQMCFERGSQWEYCGDTEAERRINEMSDRQTGTYMLGARGDA